MKNTNKMQNDDFQVCGLGQCCLDYIGKIPAYPLPDMKCEFTDMTIQGGGPIATALTALSRWGVSCTITGVIGDDPLGPMIAESLKKEGVDISRLLTRKGFDSQFAFVMAEPGAGRRTIFWRRPTGPPPGPDELDYELISKAEVLYTDGIFPAASIAACRAARQAGVKVVVDAGSMRHGMLDIARSSDCFIASETFANDFLGREDPLEACRSLAKLGPGVVGVTLGPKGYIAMDHGRIIRKPAHKVKAIDTTGCGDIFHAGFTYGLLKGWDTEKSLDFGAWAAAMVSLKLGGRAGIPPAGDYGSVK